MSVRTVGSSLKSFIPQPCPNFQSEMRLQILLLFTDMLKSFHIKRKEFNVNLNSCTDDTSIGLD